MALRGIVLALEILATVTLERAREAPRSRVRVGDDVLERVAACREILSQHASARQRVALAPMRAWLERIERAYLQFDRAPDRVASSVALLELARKIRGSSSWLID